ncbi:MAG: serine/threonine protein phosphatase [Polyangiaceae bacterium]|nr:serine/threonine protein phosphatase [Polyangiaceae bacterium]
MMPFSSDPKVAEQQMHAIIYYLTAFGYVDGEFDLAERGFLQDFIAKLVRHRADQAMPDSDPLKEELIGKWTRHFHEVLEGIDHEIRENLREPTADGEDSTSYALTRLKLRCFELFKQFDEEGRWALLSTADELIHADGKVHEAEANLRKEMVALLESPVEIADEEIEEVQEGVVVVEPAQSVSVRQNDHPFFSRTEWNYAADKETFAQQAARDVDLLKRARRQLEDERQRGRGKLGLGHVFADFSGDAPFMDGHVVVHPPGEKDYELLVLGDLHGCYSCLKAALLQADFFEKVQRYHDAPDKEPNMLLVLLGDYIDRGRFSYNGILRTVLQLYLTVPQHVIPLRGNHEYYVELNGRIYGAVRPSEAMASLNMAGDEVFAEYMHLFEALPNLFVFDRLAFVHAGIPRDDTLAEKFQGLDSLNDPDIRFQMLWSDPSQADAVPAELQKQSARFAFGKKQFRSFMHKLGCTTMVRGHERVVAGFKEIFSEPDARLINLFSAGGAKNEDLPKESNYREVTPMALTVRRRGGVTQMAPFAIDYERFNDPEVNAFFRDKLQAT